MFYKWFIVATYLYGVFTGINVAQAASDITQSSFPDAHQHLVKGLNIDFEHLRDPFSSYLDKVALRGKRLLIKQQSKLSNRQRDPLEVFDLSTLSLVGIYTMGDKRVAVMQDSQGKGYTVKQGNYMGKHSGQIKKIDRNTVYLVEKTLNIDGKIVDQQVKLTLKEVNN